MSPWLTVFNLSSITLIPTCQRTIRIIIGIIFCNYILICFRIYKHVFFSVICTNLVFICHKMLPLLTVLIYAVHNIFYFILVFSHIKSCPWNRKHGNCCYFNWIFCPPSCVIITTAKQSCNCLNIVIIFVFIFVCKNFIMYIIVVVLNCCHFCCIHINTCISNFFIANSLAPKN